MQQLYSNDQKFSIPFVCSLFLLLGVSLFFTHCTPKINTYEPPIDDPKGFSPSGQDSLALHWWESFDDPELNRLMDSSFSHNMNLINIWYQLQEATSVRKMQSTFLLPDIEGSAQTAISRPQPDFAGGENTQIGVSANYEIDLWGRIKAGLQAEDFRLQASYYDYQAAAMTLSSQITTTWFQLITAKKQLNLAQEQIAINEKIIQLIKVRFGAGQIKGVDILRQQQLVEEAKNQKLIYETDLAVLKNQLAVLTGVPPQNFHITAKDSLPELPPHPQTGLPLDLVRRRPDIQRAYNNLLAADRDMAVAVRNKFPRLSFNLSGQTRSNTYPELFNDWAYTLGANLVAPLLYWGRLRAEVDRAEAVKNQQLYNYGQSILMAFQEVENALIREKKQAERLKVIDKRITMAKKVQRQLQNEYINGFIEYLDILVALDEQQQLEREKIQLKQQLFESRIALYRALAGNFDLEFENETQAANQNINEQ
ncbi:TolC family protein [Echinicola strongylocentroti]|uniref:TolC family protein n=1 Tax=Echinicola strongylocentroti TaxID=1795355 RepID=A0A2Z4IPB6_9BACT|nr:TolC family protein [Echinicola strongylocentroti]AWW32962.1 TolC family protein [Echinicola strongylocentroti]